MFSEEIMTELKKQRNDIAMLRGTVETMRDEIVGMLKTVKNKKEKIKNPTHEIIKENDSCNDCANSGWFNSGEGVYPCSCSKGRNIAISLDL